MNGVHRHRVSRVELTLVYPCFSVLGPRFSVLVSRFSFLVSRFSFLVSHFSFLTSRFSLLASRFSILHSPFSILHSRLSTLDSRLSITDYRLPITDYRLPILDYRFATRDTRHATRDTRHATRDTRHATFDDWIKYFICIWVYSNWTNLFFFSKNSLCYVFTIFFQASIAEDLRLATLANRTKKEKYKLYAVRFMVNLMVLGLSVLSAYLIFMASQVSIEVRCGVSHFLLCVLAISITT